MPFIQVEPTEKMLGFVWSPSKLEAYVGDLEWATGCGVKLYLDHFAGPTFDVARKHFTFGTCLHEILENYHKGEEPPDLKTLLGWLRGLWIPSEHKKKIIERFGSNFLDRLECNEPVGISHVDRSGKLLMEDLENCYQTVNMISELARHTAKRWMFLGYESEQDETNSFLVAEKVLRGYREMPYVRPVELESWMHIDLGGVKVRGRIDRVDEIGIGAGMGYRVVDYKTSKATKTSNELKKDFQMVCYNVAMSEKYRVPNHLVEVGLLYLKPEIKVGGESVPQPMKWVGTIITPDIVEKAKSVIVEADRRVKSGVFHYVGSQGKWKCTWCDHRDICGVENI